MQLLTSSGGPVEGGKRTVVRVGSRKRIRVTSCIILYKVSVWILEERCNIPRKIHDFFFLSLSFSLSLSPRSFLHYKWSLKQISNTYMKRLHSAMPNETPREKKKQNEQRRKIKLSQIKPTLLNFIGECVSLFLVST